jgi:hypothetical protein
MFSDVTAGLLPDEARGWLPEGPDGVYDATSLYEYINGGAEVYLALNVRSVTGRRYAKGNEPEIIADVFLMGSSPDAFGAYHHDIREGDPAGIGAESEYADGALAFWKGPYFVSILALDETPGIREAVLEIGSSIAASIREEGGPPDLLERIPRGDRDPDSVRYFHTHQSLGRYHSLGADNLLGLDAGTEGVLARYGGKTHSLVLIRYPSAGNAREALSRFRSRYPAPEHGAAGRVLGNLLAVVPDAPSAEAAERAVEEVK